MILHNQLPAFIGLQLNENYHLVPAQCLVCDHFYWLKQPTTSLFI